MQSMDYSSASHLTLEKVRRPLFMAEDSGIESEFELAADESFGGGSMQKIHRDNNKENETLSGRLV